MTPTMKILFAVLIVSVAVAVHYSTTPVPSGFSARETGSLRIFALVLTISYRLQSLSLKLGATVTNFVMTLQRHITPENPDIIYRDTLLNNVTVRVYEPVKQTQKRAGLIYVHGGGWVLGNRESYHVMTSRLAAEIGDVVLIAIDYRKAWEAPFPALIDDVTDASIWFLRHLDQFNVDSERVAIAGDSAGGTLAAALCQRLLQNKKYQGLPKIKFQGLLYPALQMFDLGLPSYQLISKVVPSDIAKTTPAFYSSYIYGNHDLTEIMQRNNHTSPEAKQAVQAAGILSHKYIPDDLKEGFEPPSLDHGDIATYDKIKDVLLDPDFAPLMRHDLSGLPPAFIATAKYDLLRDDGILYAQRLKEAGVDVLWQNYHNAIHGFCFLVDDPLSLEAGKQCYAEFIKYVREKLRQVRQPL